MHGPCRRTTCAVALVAVVLGIASLPGTTAAAPAAQMDDAASLYATLTGVLDPDLARGRPRIAQANIDASGDATIVFTIQNAADDPEATRAGALSDTLALLRTAYQSPAASDIGTLTVLGTFPFKSTRGRAVRDLPVLRAVLSAERASLVDWDRIGPAEVAGEVDIWWLQEAFANVGSPPQETPQGQPSLAPSTGCDPTLAQLRPRLTIALAHLTEALSALSLDNRQIGRSQVKQFFDTWNDVDGRISDLYPSAYAALDVDLEKAEIALFRTLPENVPAARGALQNVRASLAEILSSDPPAAENCV